MWAGLCGLGIGDLAQANCRQALAIGMDVSGSVDALEYRLQTDGLAKALLHPEVLSALLALPDAPVRLAIFEWSGADSQRIVVPWRTIRAAEDAGEMAAALTFVERMDMSDATAIGAAKRFGATLLATQEDCWRHVLDLSGDGMSNTGQPPEEVVTPGITINGLVISEAGDADGIGALARYYATNVIQGRDAFTETALGFEDFEAAMVRKLKRELRVLAVSSRN